MEEEETKVPSSGIRSAGGIGEADGKRDGEDLSAQIIVALVKSKREHLTCRRITRDHYRCNWWTMQDTGEYDNPNMAGLLVTTSRITKSQFLHVTKSESGLDIRVVS